MLIHRIQFSLSLVLMMLVVVQTSDFMYISAPSWGRQWHCVQPHARARARAAGWPWTCRQGRRRQRGWDLLYWNICVTKKYSGFIYPITIPSLSLSKNWNFNLSVRLCLLANYYDLWLTLSLFLLHAYLLWNKCKVNFSRGQLCRSNDLTFVPCFKTPSLLYTEFFCDNFSCP